MSKKIRRSPSSLEAQVEALEQSVEAQVEVQTTEAEVPSTEPQVEVKPTKKLGIGKKIVELLKAGDDPKVVLEKIIEEFNSKTTIACVYWYKSKINKGFY